MSFGVAETIQTPDPELSDLQDQIFALGESIKEILRIRQVDYGAYEAILDAIDQQTDTASGVLGRIRESVRTVG
jgi:hypothetical protein